MSMVNLTAIVGSIGDGILLFLLIYKYIGLKGSVRMITSGILTGAFIYFSTSLFRPHVLPDSIGCVAFLLAMGWIVLTLTQPSVRFADYLFVFSVGYFCNIGVLIFATLVSVSMGVNMTELLHHHLISNVMLHLLQYITFLTAGLYLLLKREKIQLISSVGTPLYCGIIVGAIFFSTLFLSLSALVAHSAAHTDSTDASIRFAFVTIQPVLTLLMICLICVFFVILSCYTFRYELLKTRLKQQELINERLSLKIEELRPLKHGMRNRFAVIHALTASESNEALTEYIESCSKDFDLDPVNKKPL